MVTDMKRVILALVMLAMALDGCRVQAEPSVDVKVNSKEVLAPVSRLFWGTNFLFWVEDDEALADGKIEQSMKDLPVRILRYPGGTVADNFHWKTNMLDNRNMFPYEEGPEQSDFDEFMAFCGRVHAEPMLVVNTQSWFLKDDIEGGAKEAADWVRYCKDKGYNVRYWEIGNETYWHTVMTASEYGELANVYAKAMKAVDPDIILSVNGGWDINMTGNKERTDPSLWKKMKQGYLDVSSVKESRIFKDKVEGAVRRPWTEGNEKWWKNLITTCGDNVEMISVHWYYHDNNIRHIEKKLNELKAYVSELKGGKEFLLCLSEFNCNTENPDKRLVGFAESVGRFLNVGTDIACFWPFRIGGGTSLKSNRSMMSLKEKNGQYPYCIFQLFQENLTGNMVKCECGDGVYAFASADKDHMTVVVSGRNLKEVKDVVLDTGIRGKNVQAFSYTLDKETVGLAETPLDFVKKGRMISLSVAPDSFVMITINN